MTRKYFGTDGVRGKVGETPITPEFALKLGWAAGKALARNGQSWVVMGKDTRLSGYLLESALEAGLSAAGVSVRLLGPMPTPAIAYLTRAFHADAGIVISASHNPYYDNGIKFFGPDGMKLQDEVEESIEDWLDQPMQITAPDALGKAMRQDDARGRYIEFCKSSFPFHFNLRGLKIVLDCANGAAYQVGPSVFTELGAEVIKLACAPDGLNINHECGSTHPETLQQAVVEHEADLGIAFDGDSDRVLMVDRHGQLVDGDELIVIIAQERMATGNGVKGVVGTLMSNLGMEIAVREMGLEFVRAKVGDRYVMAELQSRGWTLGGEASGHILCLDKTTTGDAIIAALQVLSAMVRTHKPLHELRGGMQKLPQVLINVRVGRRSDPMTHSPVVAAVKAAEERLADRGRVLLRASGTEPLIRVMVEGADQSLVATLAEELAGAVAVAMA
ncbi:MAG: phosphoglucosamine mutase [Moraxellaceae bacterium]|nr:phosphoglucosamine mutase [Moraxellaceae bacterium]MBP8851487.1 phosphoglucosamine mutase [Moraxellaceae bacterium]MBP9044885.1 phosphoglucosamine mutase [Moraxellaceae bacterium]MBP9730264.1 phosphoglucosamine mutase [Moraxellaceae bacterium]